MKLEGVLALDFDGVLWDSVDECREVALRTWRGMEMAPLSIEDLPRRFREGRHLCRTGHDFYVVLHLLHENPTVDFAGLEEEDFAACRRSLGDAVSRFDGEFYAARVRLRDNDFALWSGWQSPIGDAVAAVRRLQARFAAVVVATTKDEESARRLLATAGIALPLVGRHQTRDKGEQMRRIAREHGVETTRVMLVDDMLDNLLQARAAGAPGAMTAWGYNTVRLREKARAMGFPVIAGDDVERGIVDAFLAQTAATG